MKPIRFSNHAKLQMSLRGASDNEIVTAVEKGNWKRAKANKLSSVWQFKINGNSPISQKMYKYKTVEAIFADEPNEIVIITVKVYYSNEVIVK